VIPFVYLFVGEELGIFEKHGLQVSVTQMPPSTALAGLQAGELQFMAGIGSAASGAVRGFPVRVVYVAANTSDHLLIGTKDIAAIEQLRGKVVAAYQPLNTVNTMTVEMMRRAGLGPNDYELVNVGDTPARATAVVNGLAAATLLTIDVAMPLLDQGYPVVARAADRLTLPYVGLATATSKLADDRDLVRRVLLAAREATAAVRTQKDAVVPVIAKEFAANPADADRMWDMLAPIWTTDGLPSDAAVEFELRHHQAALEQAEPIRPEQIYDFSLLRDLPPAQ
jgi:ABC-type nitrate/sulfonate/bicarbonate transport system substrate-binding protein